MLNQTMETATQDKCKINEYHSVKYLKKKSQGKKMTYILPNGKEVIVNGKGN